MAERSLLVLLVAIVALGGVAYFAFGTSPAKDDPGDTEDSRDISRADAPGAPGADLVRAETPPAAEQAPPSDAPSTEAPAPEPVAAPAYRAPEQVVMEEVRWLDLSGTDAVERILEVTGLRLQATAQARKILDGMKVNLEMEGRRASYVLGMVLLPHSLGYTVREDRLMIFVEDD